MQSEEVKLNERLYIDDEDSDESEDGEGSNEGQEEEKHEARVDEDGMVPLAIAAPVFSSNGKVNEPVELPKPFEYDLR